LHHFKVTNLVLSVGKKTALLFFQRWQKRSAKKKMCCLRVGFSARTLMIAGFFLHYTQR